MFIKKSRVAHDVNQHLINICVNVQCDSIWSIGFCPIFFCHRVNTILSLSFFFKPNKWSPPINLRNCFSSFLVVFSLSFNPMYMYNMRNVWVESLESICKRLFRQCCWTLIPGHEITREWRQMNRKLPFVDLACKIRPGLFKGLLSAGNRGQLTYDEDSVVTMLSLLRRITFGIRRSKTAWTEAREGENTRE